MQKKIFAIVILVGGLFGLSYWLLPPVAHLNTGSQVVTRWLKGKGRVEMRVGPQLPAWMPLDSVSLHVVHAIIASEDARFYEHHGFDLREIWLSFLANIRAARYARGASTITQQLVKIAFLSQDKTILRKLREIAGALYLEVIMSKEDILSWYLNLIELGDGVYGIQDAAKHYFDTEPELLTVAQAVHLALVLPSPNRWSKGLRRKDLTPFGHQRFASILTKMRSAGYITQGQWEQTMAVGNFGAPINNEP